MYGVERKSGVSLLVETTKPQPTLEGYTMENSTLSSLGVTPRRSKVIG
ncbi:MAG: hypothetical protein WBI45_04610 [Defluviitoga tunisiensis]